MNKKPVGVLISGRGSNLNALIAACAAPDYPARIVVVISNKASAGGLAIAREAGIPALVLDHKAYPDRAAFDRAITEALEAHGAEIICMAGFMRLVTAEFVNHWSNRLLNIHPSLLPAFKGTDTHRRALAGGCTLSGCTVHLVRTEMDEGPILYQAAVPILPDDDEARLAARVLAAEHQIYPAALRLVASGAFRVEGLRVYSAAAEATRPDACLIAPAVTDA